MTIVRNACRDGALAISALQRRIERDNLLIRDRLDDVFSLGLRANQVGTFPAFVSRIGHTVQASSISQGTTSALTIRRISTLSGTVPTPNNELTDIQQRRASPAPYRSRPCKTWLKSKNPESEAVRREREGDWD